jgi:hypothetical protein
LPNGKRAGATMGSKLKMASAVDFSTKKIFKVKGHQLLVKTIKI